MKELLYIDCCIRGRQSRTRKLADAFLAALPRRYHVTRLDLTALDLKPMYGARFREREDLLKSGQTDGPLFDLARQLAAADAVVIAAPFWELSFPALLKIYIENVAVEGITFRGTERGLVGMCHGERCVYLTTRGGIYQPGDPMDQGTSYLSAMQKFFGLGSLECVSADGLDVDGMDAAALLRDGCRRATDLALTF